MGPVCLISLQGDANGDGIEDYKDIGDTIAAQKQLAFDADRWIAVQDAAPAHQPLLPGNGQTNRDEVSRAMDFYAAGELRLPPNPLAQMLVMNMLAEDVVQQIAQGEEIFNDAAGCANCHDPEQQPRALHRSARARSRGRLHPQLHRHLQ